jgi:hypothetical protein
VDQFASVLLAVHVDFFNRESLRTYTETIEGPVCVGALFDWMVFGAWCVAVGVFDNCIDGRVRTRLIDAFLTQFYTSVRERGLSGTRANEMPVDVLRSFEEYYRGWLEPGDPGSKIRVVTGALARRVLGDDHRRNTDALVFGLSTAHCLSTTRRVVSGLFESVRLDGLKAGGVITR